MGRALLRIGVMLLLAALSISVIEGELAPAESPQTSTTYEVGGRVLARTHLDGRIEFCFQPEGQEVVCPERRIVRPEWVTTDRWLASSEMRWSVPIDLSRVPSPFSHSLQPGGDPGCVPDLEGMLSTVWRVSTARYETSAYYIGNARFLAFGWWTADTAPIVTLARGAQYLAGAIVAVDRSRNVVLIEAHDQSLLADAREPKFRRPTEADLGAPVFTVSRDRPYSATATFGHSIAAVQAGELRMTGGDWGWTRRGPLFDICGNLLAITWDRWPEFAEESLADWLSAVSAEWPELPDDSSTVVNGDGRLVWYSGAEPPRASACGGAEAEWWVGLAGLEPYFFDSTALDDLGWEVVHTCTEGSQFVLALNAPPPIVATRPPICVADWQAEEQGRFTETIHRSSEAFGETRIVRLLGTSRCPWQFTHSLRIKLAEPAPSTQYTAHLIGADGSAVLGSSPGRAYRGVTDEVASPTAAFWQRWEVPEGFVAAETQIQIGQQGWRITIQDPRAADPAIAQAGRIFVRRASADDLRVCLRAEGENAMCVALSEFAGSSTVDGGWSQSPTVRWQVDLPAPVVSSLLSVPEDASRRCPIGEHVADGVWQYHAASHVQRTALYVGEGQFLVSADVIDGSPVTGLIARGEVAFAATHIATDAGSGLALLSAPDDWPLETLAAPLRFGESDVRWEGQTAWLVAYDQYDSERFSVSPARIGTVDERALNTITLGSRQRGAPLIHPCTGEVIGVYDQGDEALTAQTVWSSLARLRS